MQTCGFAKLPLLTLIVFFTVSAFAASGSITLSQDSTLNGNKLEAGSYRVTYDDAAKGDVQVTLRRGKTQVTAPATLQDMPSKANDGTVMLDTQNGGRELRRIQLAGKKTALMFGQAKGAKSSAE